MKIGVISDTHNYLDPRVMDLFADVQHILHAGDIGLPWLIQQLETLAPVTSVGGNTDDAGLRYSPLEVVDVDGRRFLIRHIINPLDLDDELKARIARERADVAIFGHTHEPFCQTIGTTLFFNPGYAGKKRFELERTVAILHSSEGELRPEYLPL